MGYIYLITLTILFVRIQTRLVTADSNDIAQAAANMTLQHDLQW